MWIVYIRCGPVILALDFQLSISMLQALKMKVHPGMLLKTRIGPRKFDPHPVMSMKTNDFFV
jgi:hypothetical protein